MKMNHDPLREEVPGPKYGSPEGPPPPPPWYVKMWEKFRRLHIADKFRSAFGALAVIHFVAGIVSLWMLMLTGVDSLNPWVSRSVIFFAIAGVSALCTLICTMWRDLAD